MLPKSTIERAMKKAGAERVSKNAVEKMAAKVEKFIEEQTKKAIKIAEHAGRKTIKKEDIDLLE